MIAYSLLAASLMAWGTTLSTETKVEQIRYLHATAKTLRMHTMTAPVAVHTEEPQQACTTVASEPAPELLGAYNPPVETVLERVKNAHDAIETLSCEIRRDSPLPDGQTVRMLSRVYYARGDRLHVENFSPARRLIVSDGTMFWSYTRGAPKGFARPIAELSEDMVRNLRLVPGTPEAMLAALEGAPEVLLEPTDEFPVRASYNNGHVVAILSLDDLGRLARIEMFDSQDTSQLKSITELSAFNEVLPGTWIPCYQQTTVRLQGVERQEITRVGNIVANEVLLASLFVADPFFRGVEFVDSFDKIGL